MATKNTQDKDIEPIVKFVAANGIRQYPFGFYVFRASDIQVYFNDRLLTSGYSVKLTEGIRGGNVVFDTAPADSTQITILAEVPFVRDSDFNEAGTFRAKVVNKELDIVMALLRQLRNSFSLSAHLPPYYKGLNLELPIPDAGKTILWNASGNGFVNSKDKIDDLYTDTKAQADLAVEKAQVATEKADIASRQAAAAKASADSAAATVTGFDAHAAEKQNTFDANAAQRTTEFDANALAKTNAFNLNASEKQEAVDRSATNAAQSAAAADETLAKAVSTIDSTKQNAIQAFDDHAAAKTDTFNSNAAEKQRGVDSTAALVQTLHDETKQFRDDAEAIANLPEATETVKGVSSIATMAEAEAGTDDRKIITPVKLINVLKVHAEDFENPHRVSKAQVGLDKVDNTADLDKPISSAVKQVLDAKQPMITGAASTVVSAYLSASRALISDSSGKIAASGISTTELGYLSGVSSAIQTQLNSKATPANIQNYQPNIITLTQTSGTISLAVHKIYTLSINGSTTFALPAPSNVNVFNQIKIMMKVSGTPVVYWGTDQFFNKATPEIKAGSYDVYFDYDKLLGKWVAGAIPKGTAG